VTTKFVSNVVLFSFFLAVFTTNMGRFALAFLAWDCSYSYSNYATPNIGYLEEHINCNFRERGKFPLTACLDKLWQFEEIAGYVVQGRCFDTGLPEVGRQTLIDFVISGGSIG